MTWFDHIKNFKNYLKLERGLSGNSVESYVRDAEKLKKLDVNRVRLSLGDAKGLVLSDRCKKLSDYINDTDAILVFKDLGRQVGWKTVFLVEYAGPIAITLGLMAFRKQVYGSDPNYTFN